MRVALCQITSTPDPVENAEQVRASVAEAVTAGASLVVFPEATMARFGTRLKDVAEPLDGPWATVISAIAEAAGVLVIAGMFTPAGDGRVYNTLLVTGRGKSIGYDKIHLYDAFGFQESRTVAPGGELVSVDVEGVKIGLATCYDIRFPELFQAHGEAGAAAVVVPASWGAGEGKREQWELLVRARALASGCWVLGCGQADPATSGIETKPGVPTGIGYSTIADPFGRVHDQLGPGPGILVADIDPKRAEESRQATAVLANRRL